MIRLMLLRATLFVQRLVVAVAVLAALAVAGISAWQPQRPLVGWQPAADSRA